LLRLDPARHPHLGPANGAAQVVMLFDYRCSHCRRLDRYLQEVNSRRSRPFTIVPLATPLDRACNPHATEADPSGESCELARLALAVWRVEPAAFADFHRWLLADAVPPQAAEARRRAERRVGAARLAKALDDGEIDDRLGQQGELYGFVGAGATPKLLLPKAILTGTPDSAAVLQRLLAEELLLEPQE
jgi:protein-disulfide isomerase